ncbi:hypothetical protein EW145_g775 [Phellinidium pouzarii]|uniref:UAA transporter n=1 Tax=Phellinidium pouzarii TaxID=167371 RepID=A0A4S4LH25_9AGAM|nr:hypothetical protein EW145_g775 [Phellinidium pouzarii]
MFFQMLVAGIAEPLITFSLIFGGCCSNALTLEVITSEYPPAGTLVTFAQFLLVALVGLRNQLVVLATRIPRVEALQRAIALLRNSNVNNVTIYGPNTRITRTFAQELAALVEGTLSERVDGNSDVSSGYRSSFHESSKDTPPAIFAISLLPSGQSTSAFPSSASAQDYLAQMERRISERMDEVISPTFKNDVQERDPSKTEMNTVPDALLHASTSGPQSTTFKIVLQGNYRLLETADLVLNVSDPEHPALLYPRSERFTFNPFRYRFKPRRVPLMRYAVQVLLFLLVNLLNNAAFAYQVPMAVHIIFRSGGLVVNMLMGWIIEKRRYTKIQICSVILITLGVALTTLSSSQSHRKVWTASAPPSDEQLDVASYGKYAIGIGILSLALLLSGLLGLAQDRAFERYGRGDWAEAMFYLHVLALPLFGFVSSDLVAQIRTANAGPQVELNLTTFFTLTDSDFIRGSLPPLPYFPIRTPTLRIPVFYVPLVANVLTQLMCVAGVNRLTAHTSSLTVALVLVVRKAVSLAVSVLLLGDGNGSAALWVGATAVLTGTIGYALGSRRRSRIASKKDE